MFKLKGYRFGSVKDKILKLKTSYSNIPNSILEKVDRKLYKEDYNPINILK